MLDEIEINDKVVYVRGFSRGAIYNLNDGNVYSINAEACKILEQFIIDRQLRCKFLDDLSEKSLIRNDFHPRNFSYPVLAKTLDFVWIELTETCNLRCIHCYEGDMHKDDPKAKLSFTQWKDVLRQLKDVGCRKLEFIGGEPTMHSHFEELLKFAVSLGHNVEIFTNLQAFNERIVHFIKKNNITVHFSIYGSSAATHDLITNKSGSFKILMYWVKRLVESNIRVKPAITIMRPNQNDIDNIFALIKNIGIPTKQISIDAVRATAKRSTAGLEPIDPMNNLALRRKPNFHASQSLFHKAKQANTCLFGKFTIQSDGIVSPCEFSRNIIYGNIKRQTIAEILDSETLMKYWYFDFSKIEQCKECEYRFACIDCRMHYCENGFNNKNPRCLYNPMKGKWEVSRCCHSCCTPIGG